MAPSSSTSSNKRRSRKRGAPHCVHVFIIRVVVACGHDIREGKFSGTGEIWNGKTWHNNSVPHYAAAFEGPKPFF